MGHLYYVGHTDQIRLVWLGSRVGGPVQTHSFQGIRRQRFCDF